MTSAAAISVDDPTFYPIEEKVGEDSLQTFIAELFRHLVDRWLVLCGKPTFVGADQFIYWMKHHPEKVVAPDVYVLPGVPRDGRVSCLKVWEAGVVPTFALEIVSPNSVEKDYREVPTRYAELGVSEVVIFDPDHHKGRDRLRFQVLRRSHGELIRVTAHDDNRVRSRVLGCWIRAVGEGDKVRLRLGTGKRGEELVPTEAEDAEARAEQAEARAEQERAHAARERARANEAEARVEQERANVEQAAAENARLKAEIERLSRGR